MSHAKCTQKVIFTYLYIYGTIMTIEKDTEKMINESRKIGRETLEHWGKTLIIEIEDDQIHTCMR